QFQTESSQFAPGRSGPDPTVYWEPAMMELPLYNNVDEIREAARSCTACARSAERRQVVFGHGNPEADLMLVGEAPSAADDSTGLPFTGPAGTLLDEVLAEAGVERRQLW